MTVAYAPDALHTLRDSFALHLDASRSDSTQRIYLAALDRLIGHLEASGMPTAARSVCREHVESFIASRRDTVKPTTLSVEFRALQQFWRWCVEEDEIDRSPMERMKAPKVPDSPVPVVSVDDFRKLLKTAEGRDYNARRDTAILMLMFDTGMRRGELEGLRVDDLDLRDRLAYVTGKGGHTRAVRFGTKTAVAVDRYMRLRRGHRRADSPALWLGQDGPLTGSGFAQIIAKRCAAAGLPRIHQHQLRHTFAHEYLAAGGQEGDLQRLAGWRSPQMLRRYGASMADERARRNYESPVDRL
jgi:site-specific recombinase XerD